MKTNISKIIAIVGVFATLLIFSGTVQAAWDSQRCIDPEYSWSPSDWTNLQEYSRTDTHVIFTQSIYWNTASMDEFKSLNAYYQYEIRRAQAVWDFWYCDGEGDCTASWYWTDLPNPTPDFTEELDPPICCDNVIGDEEFEIKSLDPDALQANTWYDVYVQFIRERDKGSTVHVHTESEYCGKLPNCDFGFTFDWCQMTDEDEIA